MNVNMLSTGMESSVLGESDGTLIVAAEYGGFGDGFNELREECT